MFNQELLFGTTDRKSLNDLFVTLPALVIIMETVFAFQLIKKLGRNDGITRILDQKTEILNEKF